MSIDLETIPNIELVIGAVETVAFLVSYIFFFNWKKTAAGRALMQFVLGLILVFAINSIGTFFGTHFPGNEYPGRWLVRGLGYGYMVYTAGYLTWVLWSNVHKGKTEEAKIELRDRSKPPVQ